MGKCLVTKLNGVTNNDSLLALGEMRVKFYNETNPTKRSRTLRLGTNGQITLKIVGDGYFTDENLTANLGKSVVVNNELKSIFVSNSDLEVSISDKYNFYSISDITIPSESASLDTNRVVNLGDLKYSKLMQQINLTSSRIEGDIDSLSNLPNLTVLALRNPSGDIKSLNSITSLERIQLSGKNILGNLSSLANLSRLCDLNVKETSVIGDVSSLAALRALKIFNIPNATGDISTLRTCVELKELLFYRSRVSGDLAVLPDKVIYFYLGESKDSAFSWSSRNSSANIIAIWGSPKISNIDKMLQDQAACVKGFDASSDIYHKTISATGTRTSASDAAVQTLQSKGYTVSITPE